MTPSTFFVAITATTGTIRTATNKIMNIFIRLLFFISFVIVISFGDGDDAPMPEEISEGRVGERGLGQLLSSVGEHCLACVTSVIQLDQWFVAIGTNLHLFSADASMCTTVCPAVSTNEYISFQVSGIRK